MAPKVGRSAPACAGNPQGWVERVAQAGAGVEEEELPEEVSAGFLSPPDSLPVPELLPESEPLEPLLEPDSELAPDSAPVFWLRLSVR